MKSKMLLIMIFFIFSPVFSSFLDPEKVLTSSATEIRNILHENNILLEEYPEVALKNCEQLDIIFKDKELTLTEKIEQYKNIINNPENIFFRNALEFRKNPPNKACLLFANIDKSEKNNDILVDVSLLQTQIVFSCFANYLFNPFDTASITKESGALQFYVNVNKYNTIKNEYETAHYMQTHLKNIVYKKVSKYKEYLEKGVVEICDEIYDVENQTRSQHNEYNSNDGLFDKDDKPSVDRKKRCAGLDLPTSEIKLFDASYRVALKNENIPDDLASAHAFYVINKHNPYLNTSTIDKKHFSYFYKYIIRKDLDTLCKTGNLKNKTSFFGKLNLLISLGTKDELSMFKKGMKKLINSSHVEQSIKELGENLIKKIKEKKKSSLSLWHAKNTDEFKLRMHRMSYEEESVYNSMFQSLMFMKNPDFDKQFNNLKNNDKNEMFAEADSYTEKILENNDDIKIAQDLNKSQLFRKRWNVYFWQPTKDKVLNVFQQEGLQALAPFLGKLIPGNLNNAQEQEQVEEHINNLQRQVGDVLLDHQYNYLLYTHEDPDTFHAQEIFKKIGEKYTNPTHDKTLERKLREFQTQGIR